MPRWRGAHPRAHDLASCSHTSRSLRTQAATFDANLERKTQELAETQSSLTVANEAIAALNAGLGRLTAKA